MDNIKNFEYSNYQPYFNALIKLEKIFNKYNYKICLYGGTLLGAARNNDFIETDDDIDILFISPGKNRKEAIDYFENNVIPLLNQTNYEIKPISWTIESGTPRVCLGQYHIIQNNITLDLWIGWIDNKNHFYSSHYITEGMIKDDIFPFRKLKLKNKTFNVVQNYKLMIQKLYGNSWEIPSNYRPSLNFYFVKKKILKVIDQYGWAYHFIAQAQQKFSTHQIDYITLADLKIETIKDYDILYFSSPGMWESKIKNLIIECRTKYPLLKIIGAYAGENKYMYPDVDLVVSISVKYLPILKKKYPDKLVIFLPECTDTNFFKPEKANNHSFIVGWAGRPHPIKRLHLLDKLDFEIKKQAEYGDKYFIKDRILDPMRDFYKSISCLVLSSSSECMPGVVLEAMACGLPVVSTDVGSIRLLLDNEWIVPVNPEEIVVEEMNKKLKLLAENSELRKQVGERNRKWIETYFDWKVNQPLWDEVFDNIYYWNNNQDKIIELVQEYYNTFPEIKEFTQTQEYKIAIPDKKMNLLEIIDEYGESYYFNHLDMKKYSQLFDIDCITIKELDSQSSTFDFKKYNLVYFHSPDIYFPNQIPVPLLNIIRKNDIPIIGGYGRESQNNYSYSNLIVSLSLLYTPALQKNYHTVKTIWMPKGIDTNYFQQNKFNDSRFTVGWAGSISNVKRTELLNRLNYPILKQESQHTTEILVRETTLEPMKKFYKTIDVLILVSKSEAMPRVVLEAMACGLPIIATNVGSVELLLEPQWLITSNNDDKIISNVNNCLNILEKNPLLRKEVGERNRAWVERYFSCSIIQPLWDKIMECTCKKDYDTIVAIINNYLRQFKGIIDISPYLIRQ